MMREAVENAASLLRPSSGLLNEWI